MAYRAGGGSYATFLKWSRQHPQYQSDTYVREQWRSFANTHSITAATLFDEVFRRFPGWKKPSEREPDYVDPAEDDDDWEGEPGDEAETAAADDQPLPLYPAPEEAAPYPIEALGPLERLQKRSPPRRWSRQRWRRNPFSRSLVWPQCPSPTFSFRPATYVRSPLTW